VSEVQARRTTHAGRLENREHEHPDRRYNAEFLEVRKTRSTRADGSPSGRQRATAASRVGAGVLSLIDLSDPNAISDQEVRIRGGTVQP